MEKKNIAKLFRKGKREREKRNKAIKIISEK